MSQTENKTNRKAIHSKDEKFNTYVDVLMFMIENKDKTCMKSDIKQSLFPDDKTNAIKVMVSRAVEFYISSGIFQKVTEITNEDGKTVELKSNQTQLRLYDNNIDGYKIEDDSGNEVDDPYYSINLHIPKGRDNRYKFCQTVSSMITSIPNIDIYNPTLRTMVESKLFGFQTDFASQTIAKVILKKHNLLHKNSYSLDIVLSIIESKINVNVKFVNMDNTIELKNTKIKKITIRENSFDIHFDNFISQHQTDIKQILSIENSDENGLRNDIEKVKSMLDELPHKNIEEITELLTGASSAMNIFEF